MSVFDVALRTAGGALAVLLALGSALLETIAASAWIGPIRAPWAILAALAGNLFLIWFAWETVGRRWAMWLPVVPWTGLILMLAIGTDEGDIGVPNTWVGVGMVFAGLFAFAVPIFMYGGRPMRRPPSRQLAVSSSRSAGGGAQPS